jgi:hypothetical protein
MAQTLKLTATTITTLINGIVLLDDAVVFLDGNVVTLY